ncbi:hypothetical protein SLA2020_051490 [Shorea laevis]
MGENAANEIIREVDIDAIGPMFISDIVPMDENAADEIMRDIDVAGEIVEEEEEIVDIELAEEEIELIDIELEEEEIELIDREFSVDNATKEIGEEEEIMEENDVSPIEEVQQTVPTTDDPMLPALTFRVWLLGMLYCVLLSVLNSFFRYRTKPFLVSTTFVQLVTRPIGNFLAKVLPSTKFHICNSRWGFSLNPGPFNVKEHVLISIFAQTGTAFGGGTAYAVGIVDVIRLFYHKKITFFASWMLVMSTQLLGYGLAGIMRKFVVEPAHMWWPDSLVQVSFFRALHEKDNSRKSREQFFFIALACSFTWFVFPGYFFGILTSISWVC